MATQLVNNAGEIATYVESGGVPYIALSGSAVDGYQTLTGAAVAKPWADADFIAIHIRQDDDNWSIWKAVWNAANGLLLSDGGEIYESAGVITDGATVNVYGVVTAEILDGRYAPLGAAPATHASTHAAGGNDELTPAGIGAATTAQGALADTAVQPADLASGTITPAAGDLDLSALGGAADHGSLTGLADDDHAQYHNDARGDARYSQLGHDHNSDYDPLGTAASAVASHESTYDHTAIATAVQPADLASGTITPKTGDLDLNTLGGVTDHGALTGLADDDHSQYHNDARGDARYSQLGHDHDGDYDAAGTAASAVTTHETDPTSHAADVSQAEAEVGTETTRRWWSPQRVWQAIQAWSDAREELLFAVALGDLTSDAEVGEREKFPVPRDCTFTRIYIGAATAPTGSALTYDVEDGGATILNAALSIAATALSAETTDFSGSASSYSMTKGNVLSVDCDAVGSTAAGAGVKIWFFGRWD